MLYQRALFIRYLVEYYFEQGTIRSISRTTPGIKFVILVTAMRRYFQYGKLSLIDASGNRHHICDCEGPTVVLRITDDSITRGLLTSSSTSWGEAYMNGKLVFEEGSLIDFLEVYSRTEFQFSHSWAGEAIRRIYSLLALTQHFNPVGRAQKNVQHHYDLSAELYDHFLDVDRQYSCGYFPQGDEDIDTAQLLKKRHIAAKLDIRRGMHVLDIGSGWGGMGLYLAKHFDCRVTGVTLSEEQYKLSNQRAQEAGVTDRVAFELRDYRDLDEQYDRIVSVGMLEHVGQFHLREYFKKLRNLLKPDGVALVHSISRMDKPQPISAWTRKYIFPGAYVPATSQLADAIENAHLWLTDLENLRFHYVHTLQRWHQRFAANRDKVVKLYDERFCRMWEMYLLGSETSFRYQNYTVFQMQITRDINTLPITRDYQYQAEQALAEKDSG